MAEDDKYGVVWGVTQAAGIVGRASVLTVGKWGSENTSELVHGTMPLEFAEHVVRTHNLALAGKTATVVQAPGGWQLVPKIATDDMVQAARDVPMPEDENDSIDKIWDSMLAAAPACPGVEERTAAKSEETGSSYPELVPGSCWRHRNGAEYSISYLTNVPDPGEKARPGHPIGVVYFNTSNGRLFSRDAADWSRSFTRLPASESDRVWQLEAAEPVNTCSAEVGREEFVLRVAAVPFAEIADQYDRRDSNRQRNELDELGRAGPVTPDSHRTSISLGACRRIRDALLAVTAVTPLTNEIPGSVQKTAPEAPTAEMLPLLAEDHYEATCAALGPRMRDMGVSQRTWSELPESVRAGHVAVVDELVRRGWGRL